MYVPHERRALILRLLEQRGYLRSAELAEELGVTDETIRTDLIALQERRLLRRVHGGARFIPPTGGAEDASRLDCQLIERLMPQLSEGMKLYVDASPLAHALLARLGELPCTVLTPSAQLLLALSSKAMPQEVIMPGGTLDKESELLSSDEAEAFFSRHAPDAALLCPPSLLSPDCIAYHHKEQAKWAAAASLAATRTIIAAPAHALYTQAAYTAACTVHLIVSEDNLPPAFDGVPSELIPYLSPADLREDAAL